MISPNIEKETRWHFRHSECVAWASWEGEYIVFHRPSGMTHFLNESSARLLREVLAEPRTAAEVAELLANGGGDDEKADWFEEAKAMLNYLEELGLIARTS